MAFARLSRLISSRSPLPCRSFGTAAVLPTVEENQQLFLQTSVDANALPNDVPPELDNVSDVRVSGRGKMKTPQHREGAALTSPGLKEHDGLRASERRSDNERVYTNLSMKALTLESLGFTEDSDEVEDATAMPIEDDQKQQTKDARNRKGRRSQAKDEESIDVISEQVVKQVRASPEEMKRAALDAAVILAKVAGAKIFINKPVATHATQHVIKETDDENGLTESKMLPDRAEDVGLGAAEKPFCDHPWPEWVEFLQYLYAQSYFEGSEEWTEEGKSILETSCTVRRATFAFGRERSDIFRSLSQKDLRVLANFGCPDTERKTSNASKRLRALFDIPEREVCQKCSLRKSCSRPFIEPQEKAAIETLDVVRVILGFASVDAESSGSYPKGVENSARALLKEIVALSRGLENIPRKAPVEKLPRGSFPRSPLTQMRSYTSAVAGPRRDWICPACDFMNFARNKKCRECGACCPQKQEIHLGDWDCPQCRFLNFSKNNICRECQTERPTEAPWTGDEHLCEYRSTGKMKNERSFAEKFIRNEKSCSQGSRASVSRSKSEYEMEESSDSENDAEISDMESLDVSTSECDEEDAMDNSPAQSKDSQYVKSRERSFHSQLSAKPTLTKRAAITRKVDAEGIYEVSSEDGEHSGLDSGDSIELQDSQSEVDLSDEEVSSSKIQQGRNATCSFMLQDSQSDVDLSDEEESSSKIQRGRNATGSFRWSDGQKKERRDFLGSPSKTRFLGSKISDKWLNDSKDKAAAQTSTAARIKPAMSSPNGMDSDGKVLEWYQPKLRIGKSKGGQPTVATGKKVGNACEGKSFKAPNPVISHTSQWSNDSRDKTTTWISKAVRVNSGKSISNGTDSDGQLFESSQPKLRIGKSKVGQPTVTSGKMVGVTSVSCDSLKSRSSKAPNSINSKGAKPLFDWSDSEGEELDGTLRTTVKRGQVNSGRKVGTIVHHPQKNRSGEKGRKGKR